MTETLEQSLADGIANAEDITARNDALARGEHVPGYGSYATEPGCGTKAVALVFGVTGALAALGWMIGGMA